MKILIFRDLEIATPKILTDQICNFVNFFLIICGFFKKNITTFTAPKNQYLFRLFSVLLFGTAKCFN